MSSSSFSSDTVAARPVLPFEGISTEECSGSESLGRYFLSISAGQLGRCDGPRRYRSSDLGRSPGRYKDLHVPGVGASGILRFMPAEAGNEGSLNILSTSMMASIGLMQVNVRESLLCMKVRAGCAW